MTLPPAPEVPEAPVQRRYEVRPTEAGAGTTLTPTALLDQFQDIAGRDADRLGVGLEHLSPIDRAWVLHRIVLAVHAPLPAIGEGVTLATWPAPVDGLFAARHALATADDGTRFASITTRWLFIDVSRRRPLRTPIGLLPHVRHDLDAPVTPGDDPRAPEAPTHRTEAIVQRRDLDVMQHANNVCFLEWMLEALPGDVAARPLVRLDAVLRAEALYGDRLTAVAGPEGAEHVADGESWLHGLHRGGTERPIATMRTVWA